MALFFVLFSEIFLIPTIFPIRTGTVYEQGDLVKQSTKKKVVYYVDTVGKNTAAIKAYIQNQLKEDLEYDQMSLVEYIDPFTGEPVKKNKK